MNSIAEKRCPKCGKYKPLDGFSYKKARKRLDPWCKRCNADNAHRWAIEHAEQKKESDKRWYTEHTEQARENNRKWIIEHPEQVREGQKRYSAEHKEKRRQYSHDWYKKHPEQARANHRRWLAENPGGKKAHDENRRARKRGNGGTITRKEWRDLCKKYENKCLCCGADKRLSMDHIIPLKKGGPNIIENVQPLCVSCNSSKGQKIIDYRPKEQNA